MADRCTLWRGGEIWSILWCDALWGSEPSTGSAVLPANTCSGEGRITDEGPSPTTCVVVFETADSFVIMYIFILFYHSVVVFLISYQFTTQSCFGPHSKQTYVILNSTGAQCRPILLNNRAQNTQSNSLVYSFGMEFRSQNNPHNVRLFYTYSIPSLFLFLAVILPKSC